MTTNYNTEKAVRSVLAYYHLANKREIREGKEWYRYAHNLCVELSQDYGVDLTKVIGVMSALSPRNRWDRNVLDCELFVSAYSKGADLTELVSGTYQANNEKAIRILEWKGHIYPNEVSEILHGNKTVSFFFCILDNSFDDVVTVDSHAYGVALGNGERIRPKSLTNKQYLDLVNVYIEATERINEQGHTYKPMNIQAITWLTYRRIHKIV